MGYLPVRGQRRRSSRKSSRPSAAVGFLDGKADPALLAALKSPKAFSRAAAARALCKAGGNSSWKIVRPLLTDSDPAVRFQVAAGLGRRPRCSGDPGADRMPVRRAAPLAGQGRGVSGEPGRGMDRPRSPLEAIWYPVSSVVTVWATWWQKTSGELLLRELQARTLTDEELARAEALLRKLETEQGEAGPDRIARPDRDGAAGRSARAPRRPARAIRARARPLPAAWKSSSGNSRQSPYPKRCFGCWRCADRQAPWPRSWRFCLVPRTRR